jgi:hypothetical protein
MKLHVVFITLLSIASLMGKSQNTNINYNCAIKVYNMASYEEHTISMIQGPFSNKYVRYDLQLFHPTIAVEWKTKKNNFHEIELTSFTVGQVETIAQLTTDSSGIVHALNGNNLSSTFISLRYEYILNFCKSKDKKLVPSMGFGINPYFRQDNLEPQVSSFYPESVRYIGARTYLIPRLTYYPNSKLFIDVNIPLCVFDAYSVVDKEQNPAIPENLRTITEFNYEEFSKIFSARIGVGIKI